MAVYNRKDSYYKKAKKEGYKSRAAYKIQELNERFKILKQGYAVLDCGAAPGGWSQVALECVGRTGKVVGVDLDEITGINEPNFTSIAGDFTQDATIEQVLSVCAEYDTVISDIAPHTTGIRDADHFNSVELVRCAFEFAKKTLKNGGTFAFKLFEGGERPKLVSDIKKHFKDIKTVRPDATRNGSMEMYIVALGFKKAEE